MPVARYAVAVARRAQRMRPTAVGLVLCAIVQCALIFYAGRDLARHEHASFAALAVLALLDAWLLLSIVAGMRFAPTAELANMRFLQQAGDPYPTDADPRPMPMPAPWLEIVLALPMTFAIYDLTYGLLTLAVDGKTITLTRVIERGAVWAALMTVFVTALTKRKTEEASARPTAGTRSQPATRA